MGIVIKRNGVLVSLHGCPSQPLEAIKSYMSYDKRETVAVRGKIQMSIVPTRFWLDQDGVLVFPCGFIPRVCGILSMYGLALDEYQRLDRPPTLEYDLSGVDVHNLRPEQEKMLAAVVEHEGGQVISPTGCHAKGQGILMFDGSVKQAQEVAVGDFLMGPDSRPREVKQLCRGRGKMFRITPVKGEPWVVNEDHILTLVRTNDGTKMSGRAVDIPLKEWLRWGVSRRHVYKLFRVPVEFSSEGDLPVDPYVMGLLLGDGCFRGDAVTFTKPDRELLDCLSEWAVSVGARPVMDSEVRGTLRFGSISGAMGTSVVNSLLRDLGLWHKKSCDKFIPEQFLTASREDRSSLLAGLLDTDGYLGRNTFEYSSASKKLAEGVLFVARSLGAAAYMSVKQVKGVDYYRVSISGDLTFLPMRLPRKTPTERKQKKDVLRAGFKVEEMDEDDYYGFVLDCDHRYLLDDFTVTHNSGKSWGLREICSLYPNAKIVVAAPGRETTATMRRYLVEKFGEDNVGQVGGGKRHTRRITATTYDSVLKVEDLHKVDILIADEGHRTPAVKYEQRFMSVTSPVKRFMFTATPEGRSDNAELTMEALFGPEVLNIAYQESVATGSILPIHVIVKDQPYGPAEELVKQIPVGPKRDRVCIWRNMDRNEMIANDVLETMQRYDDPQVLVLVDKTEHALVLKQFLPDFHLVHGDLDKTRRARLIKQGVLDDGQKTMTSKQRDEAREQFESGELKRVLATQVFATGVSSNHCQVVAIASGTGATIQFLQSIGRAGRKCDEIGKTHATVLMWRDTFARSYTSRAAKLVTAARKQGHKITRVQCIPK